MSASAPNDPVDRGGFPGFGHQGAMPAAPAGAPATTDPADPAGPAGPAAPTGTDVPLGGSRGRGAGGSGAGRRGVKVAVEWLAILAVAVLAAVLIRTYAVEPFYIPSGSMEPTLMVGDRVLVNKLSYDMHSVHRGDVVVFSKPPNDVSNIKDLIKRVIGLPGESISAHDGSVYINGRQLPEPWLPKGLTTAAFAPVVIPSGDYFMMGDNRGDSADSRVIGPVPGKLFVGRAFAKVWPPSRIGGL